jgi:hypothetical protein
MRTSSGCRAASSTASQYRPCRAVPAQHDRQRERGRAVEVLGAQSPLEQLAHHAEGELALELRARGVQHGEPVRGRLTPRGLELRGLPDSRRPPHREDAPRAPGRAVARGPQMLALEQSGHPKRPYRSKLWGAPPDAPNG